MFRSRMYALWEVIVNWEFMGTIPVTTPSEIGNITTTKMTVLLLLKERRVQKESHVKARILLLMALPNEHQLTFDHASSSESLDSIFNRLQRLLKVKKSAGASNDDKNLAFVTTSGASSTNNINIVNPEVSTATTKVKTANGAGFDWSDMAEEEIQANMALMAFLDSEVSTVRTRKVTTVRVKKVCTVRIIREKVSTVSFVREKVRTGGQFGSLEYLD
ncbi:hypothetical protein Tco_0742670 [Tanacetum coccineum]